MEGKAAAHFHFYVHDNYGTEQPSAAKVVSGLTSVGSGPRYFGDIVVLNNPLTAGADPASRAVGRAKGFAARVSADGVVSELIMTVVFEEEGPHRGSSVTVVGPVDLSLPIRELAVVGGTGRFRLARGYTFTKSVDYNLATDGVIEIDLHVEELGPPAAASTSMN